MAKAKPMTGLLLGLGIVGREIRAFTVLLLLVSSYAK